ncbi:MAG: DUF5916 domain-containing protein [Bacteroidota bacterium]
MLAEIPTFRFILTLAGLFLAAALHANTPKVKAVGAARTAESPVMDGRLDEAIWRRAPVATDFVQTQPVNGAPASQKSEVRVLYNDQSVFIGAMLYDTAPDSILQQLSKRDVGDRANTDYFSVMFDTYDDDQNAFNFSVSAAGVQTDSRVSQVGEDVVWDAVWRSEVRIVDNGWIVEMEIPYSALRFSKKPIQDWGMQFQRIIRRNRETTYWNFVDRAVEGVVNQFGSLQGLEGIEPPVRLALTPYISAYAQRFSPGNDASLTGETDFSFAAGADLKLGISEAFTLDMTLVPDFGQVVADNQVLNLSPFEVRFQENRQFFTEGTELFNIAGVFYSRRIGGTPRNRSAAFDSLRTGDSLVSNPSTTRLLNAFKISGRTKGKTGLGVFNAVTAPSRAVIAGEEGNREVVTQALTNYSVLVADQSFAANSYASFINTNRIEADGFMGNVSAARFKLADNTNTWFIQGELASSQRWQKVNRGDPELGYKYWYRLGKSSGNFIFNLGQNVESAQYNPNDMGFLMAPNEFTDFARAEYNLYRPIWKFLAFGNSVELRHNSLYAPRRYANVSVNYRNWFQLKTFDFFGTWFNAEPFDNFDFFESRVIGRAFARPAAWSTGGFFSSNYARRFALDFEWEFGGRPEWRQNWRNFRFSPRFRFNDKLQVVLDNYFNTVDNDKGFVTFDDDGNSLIGTRNRNDLESILNVDYTFTNRIALSFRARHYWSRVTYRNIELLGREGYLENTPYDQEHDINFNVFNIDCVFQWRYAPGSDLFIVWKNNILESGDTPINGYFQNLGNTFTSPQTNSLSIRLLYWLDFARFQRK